MSSPLDQGATDIDKWMSTRPHCSIKFISERAKKGFPCGNITDGVVTLGIFIFFQVKTEDLSVAPGQSSPGTALIDASFQDSLRFTLSWTDSFFMTVDADEEESK